MSDERLDAESERLVTLEIEAALIRTESMRRRMGGDVGSCDPSSDDTSQTDAGAVVEMRRRA
jgi:hypothetical protein